MQAYRMRRELLGPAHRGVIENLVWAARAIAQQGEFARARALVDNALDELKAQATPAADQARLLLRARQLEQGVQEGDLPALAALLTAAAPRRRRAARQSGARGADVAGTRSAGAGTRTRGARVRRGH
jgi:hypothetical protein